MGKKLLRVALLFMLASGAARAQAPAQPPVTIEKVKDSLYCVFGPGGNVGVLVTSEGVVLIDDKFEPDYTEIMAKVKTVTSQPVKYVINTHYHADHTGGNVKFLPIAEVISTQNARRNILEHRQGNAPANLAPARITFNDEASVFLGGLEVRAHYYGRGHTDGDAVIYFPQLKAVHTGDLMSGTSPLIDYNGGGSLIAWTKTLDGVLMLDFDTVIPGHGKVTDKPGLKTYRDNVEKLRTRVTGLIRDGKSAEEIGKLMTAEYGWQPDSLQMQWNIPGMMKELK